MSLETTMAVRFLFTDSACADAFIKDTVWLSGDSVFASGSVLGRELFYPGFPWSVYFRLSVALYKSLFPLWSSLLD